MKCSLLALILAPSLAMAAQNRPTGTCRFDGFEIDQQRDVRVAEVATATAVTTWMGCDSPKGCIPERVDPGSPILIYSTEGSWTCGYYSDHRGAGPTWFRSLQLRPIRYELNPAINAWKGNWSAGGEDKITIALAKGGKALHLQGNATWHGPNGVDHFGDIEGDATPIGNRVHFEEGGPNSCTIDLTLLGNIILASDNNRCGGMNVRFEGFWKRSSHRH